MWLPMGPFKVNTPTKYVLAFLKNDKEVKGHFALTILGIKSCFLLSFVS